METELLYLSGCVIVALLIWILELRHRCRVLERHIKYIERYWCD